ncbi:hypothetical protein HMPREF9544_00053 [Escherichia coli MS 153-1]|uniref:Uncharacterized protein n=1 Tax=Escherichia coli O6:K15:H31 (strain 536 / UPEC) TaxID=362663 RepID=A0A454A9E5_ECOL5|nr:hypothetical protein ECP_3779 [Escherichia coli 536]EFJ62242.1 hypothetical protein HMPREF9553_01655 [Escherichia coli MS 200-1]EFU54821.1 hypothetical protein HMPREF9544_00053 [Escherichia coli MS 153-1]EGB83672.1 hypothetical protein HMPREF9533_01485 [Escherichia coli MS 60-1]ESE31722.1 hypothetical protein HMPREF1622_03604 [Escherichia coli A35218R]
MPSGRKTGSESLLHTENCLPGDSGPGSELPVDTHIPGNIAATESSTCL